MNIISCSNPVINHYYLQILMNVLKVQTAVLRHAQIQLVVTPALVTLAIA